MICRYLSNVISAFGLGTSNVITALKEALGLSDPGIPCSERLTFRFITAFEQFCKYRGRRSEGCPEDCKSTWCSCLLICLNKTNNVYTLILNRINICSLPDGASRRSNLGPEISSFLGDGTSNTRTLHFTLGVDNDTSVIFEVEEDTVLSSPALSLSDNNSRHNYMINTTPNRKLPFLRSSGLPFLTEAMNISPGAKRMIQLTSISYQQQEVY